MATAVSDAGLRFIAREEGEVKRDGRHVLYDDAVGNCTIGYGHLVRSGNCDGSEPAAFKRGLTDAEALDLLRSDADRFVQAVRRLIRVPLNQNEFDALTSLAFNIGEAGLEESTVRRKLNAEDRQGAADAFLMWNKATTPGGQLIELEGLTNRRKRERELFLSPIQDSPPKEARYMFYLQPLIALHSALALDAEGWGTDLGTRVITWPSTGGANQRWVVEDAGPGEYRIRNAHNGLVLDVRAWNTANGELVHLWEWTGGANQRWRIEVGPEGTGRIVSAHSGKVLDVDSGGVLTQWDDAGALNQRFVGAASAITDARELRVNVLPPPPAQAPAGEAVHPDPVGQINAWGYEDGVAGFQLSFAWYDIGVDGGAGPQTARAVQVVVDNGGKLSPNFHMDEFRSKGNGRLRIHRDVIRLAERIRERKGPWSPVSAYRDEAHNQRVGGAPSSKHVLGEALDVPEGLGLSIQEARDLGAEGVGDSGGVVLHVDLGPRRSWSYG